MKNKSSVGRNWKDVRKELFTPEEIAESDLRVALIGELINARKEKMAKRSHKKKPYIH